MASHDIYFVMAQRLAYIDRLKGMAILLVIIGHLSLWAFAQGVNPVTDFVSTFHMQLFMFLSGVVISSAPHSKKLVKKLSRFWLPFIVIGSIYTISINKTLKVYFTSTMKLGYWYIFTLGFFYIFLWLIQFNSNNRKTSGKAIDIGILIGFTLIAQICLIVLPEIVNSTLGVAQFRTYWPYFGFILHFE
jgi:fucose 4-O-acetylase-like acetyltransferase